jgi:hypothetical protein
MKGGPSLTLVAPDGTRVALPLVPETLMRTRTPSGERLEFVAALDDRLGEGEAMTGETISALTALSDVTELQWGDRGFRGGLAELTVTETAFGQELQPVAATVRLAFEVRPDEGESVSVTVSGEPWRRVEDLSGAGPDDPVYALTRGEDGSLQVRFGDGRRGARPPAGEILVRARYRVGGGQAGKVS